MIFPSNHHHAFAALALVAAGGLTPFGSAALELTVSDCAGFAGLPVEDMTEDVNLFLDDAIAFTCDEVTTVQVSGAYVFRVTSDNDNVKFTNIRFEIGGGATFTFNLANEEVLGTATFTGVTGQEDDGGVFNVAKGASATFMVPMAFEGNTVTSRSSGGAVYADGMVHFMYEATFEENETLRDGDDDAGVGGALAVGPNGDVTFDDFAYFSYNVANSGGKGGAISNMGSLVFGRASYFLSNRARENGDELDGLGGALYTVVDSNTVFERRTIMHSNVAASGGAIFNEGSTTLESAGFFRGNQASGVDRAQGGHIYTSGDVTINGKVNFREGIADEGGALYVASGGTITLLSEVNYIDNTTREGDELFVAEGGYIALP